MQWKRLLWDTETPFFIDLKQLDNYKRTLIQDTCHQYANLNITEIWDVGGIDLLLQQITYCRNLRQISFEDAQFLLFAVKGAMDDLEKKVMMGSKTLDVNNKNFELYYAEITLECYTLIAYNEQKPIITRVTTVFDSPNFITTENLAITKRFYTRFQRIKNQSHKISETGELIRRKVFNRYRRKILQAEKQLI